MAISFDTNHKPVIGAVEQLENDLVVITADNASPMTFTGTRTYILGTENLIVIDPGPNSEAHLSSIMKYIGKRKVTDILLTHSHIDHSPLSRQLKIETGAKIIGFGSADEARTSFMKKLSSSLDLGGEEGIDKDLALDKKVIERTIPSISFEGRFQYLRNGKIKNKLHKSEQIMLDGAHAETDAKNLANYLRNIKVPKYAIWAMMKNKEPDFFIKQFKGLFKKIITIPIEKEQNCMSAKDLKAIAKKNQFNVDKASNFNEAIRKITSKKKKLIVCIGSLYNVGNILNKN